MWCLRVLTVGKKGLSKEAVEGFLRGCELDEVVPKRKVDHECIEDEVGDVDLECEEFAASMLDRRRGCCCRWVWASRWSRHGVCVRCWCGRGWWYCEIDMVSNEYG